MDASICSSAAWSGPTKGRRPGRFEGVQHGVERRAGRGRQMAAQDDAGLDGAQGVEVLAEHAPSTLHNHGESAITQNCWP